LEHFEENHVLASSPAFADPVLAAARTRATVSAPSSSAGTEDTDDEVSDATLSAPPSPRIAELSELKRRAIADLQQSFEMDLDLDPCNLPLSAQHLNFSRASPALTDDGPANCLSPSLLYSTSSAQSESSMSAESETSGIHSSGSVNPLASAQQPTTPTGRSTWTPPSSKPFKCAVPGCDKAYKQQNGLKYHRLHGHCNQNAFRNQQDGQSGEGSESGMSPFEEKPFGCYLDQGCGKRYKNMNGLRYVDVDLMCM
jgi:hypothetical protein